MHCVQNADIPNINVTVKLLDIIVVYMVKEVSGLRLFQCVDAFKVFWDFKTT
jgi:hypothetical protein